MNFIVLLMLGGIAGVIYLWYDGNTNSTSSIEPILVTSRVTLHVTETNLPTAGTALPTNDNHTPISTPVAGLIAKAEIFIPSASVTAPVIDVFLSGDSWDVTQLGDNVGHLQGTAWFDSPGNVVLSGHVERRNGRPGIFAGLGQLDVGDQVIVLYQGEERVYSVSEMRTVEPDDLTPLYPTDDERLTLITCDDYDFFQAVYQKRIVIVAERVTS